MTRRSFTPSSVSGSADIVALVDRAWSTHPPPTVEDRFRYEVDMGEPVGTGGERRLALIVKPGEPPFLISAYPIP